MDARRKTISGPKIGEGKRGPGRPKGSKNKIPADIRKLVLESFRGVGGARYLREQARKNPVAYMRLLGRLLPREVRAQVEMTSLEDLVLRSFEVGGDNGANGKPRA